jgi:hypothetical protein
MVGVGEVLSRINPLLGAAEVKKQMEEVVRTVPARVILKLSRRYCGNAGGSPDGDQPSRASPAGPGVSSRQTAFPKVRLRLENGASSNSLRNRAACRCNKEWVIDEQNPATHPTARLSTGESPCHASSSRVHRLASA